MTGKQPLKVTARLLDGRIATTDLALPLDSILAYAWIAKNRPDLLETSKSGIGEIFYAPLPLKRREAEGEWFWACSFACGEPVQEQTRHWHKRFDSQLSEEYVDFQGRRGKVNIGSAQYKNYRMPITVFLIPELSWYLVGDLEEVKALLEDITAIGKKTSQGYGKIRKWVVEPWLEDLSHLRAMPDPEGDDIWGIRPPYWAPQNQVKVRWSEDGRLATRAILAS